MTAGRGALIALISSLDALIATTTRTLPEPTGIDAELDQAQLMLDLQRARGAFVKLLHPESPARRDQPSTSAGTVATPGGPVLLMPRAATPKAWGTSW